MPASPTVPARARPALVPLAFTAALVALTLAHPSATRMQTWPWAALAAALWVLSAGLLIYRIATRPRWRMPGLLVTAGLALLALATVVSAGTSPFGLLSLAQTWPVLGGVALCFVLHDSLADPDGVHARAPRESIAQIIAGAGALIGTISLAWWLATASPSPWLDRNTFPFGHSTYTAGLVVLTLPWIVERAWVSRGLPRLLWVVGALGSIGALMGTSSRGGVLVLVCMGGLAAVAMLLLSPWPWSRKLLVIAALAAIAMVTVFTNPRLRELAQRRSWGDSARASNRERSAMLDAGERLGRERPWLGWGPGAVPLAYPRVRAALEGGNENVFQLHNTPIQLFATLGGLGLAAGALLLAGIGVASVRVLRARPPATTQAAAAASLVGYFLFSLTDHQLDLPIFAAIAAAGIAVIGTGAPRGFALPRLARAAIGFGGVALMALPAIALGRDLLARREFDRALTAMETANTPAVLAALDRASAFMPADSFFQHTAADWAVRQRAKQKRVEDQSDMTRAAVMRLEKSLRSGIHLEYAHFNLGWLLLNADRPRDAVAHFLATARLVPDKGGVYFGLGLALQAMHRDPEAVHAFALEWLNDPRQSTSPSWEVPALARLKPAVRAETLELLEQAARDFPAGRAAATWARWWLGDAIAPAQLTPGFSIESTAFAGLLNNSSQPGYPWAALYTAWQADAGFDSPALTHGDPAFAAALARRARRYRGDFREFLTAPIGEDGALAITYQRQRRGYGVLASHPDAPLLTDAYVVQENRIVAELAPNLFPSKGWLPGRFLLALLKENPR